MNWSYHEDYPKCTQLALYDYDECQCSGSTTVLTRNFHCKHLSTTKQILERIDLAGTWEEKNVNKWASSRIKELLAAVGLEFSSGKAEIAEVSKCVGDAFLVTVRNKKRVGYTYELTLKFKGEWVIQEEKTKINGHIDIPEFSFGELDDLQMVARLSEEKELVQQDKVQIKGDLNRLLQPIKDRLSQFEQELKER